MADISARNFGLLVAYILPGFLALWGLSLVYPEPRLWLVGSGGEGPTLGSLPYALVVSVGAGMAASVVRWAVVDTLHHHTGLKRPTWNDSRLAERLPAYELLIEIHYRYYQFYANSLVSGILAYTLWRTSTGAPAGLVWGDGAFGFLAAVFFAGSRDALRKYYGRTAGLLGTHERTVAHDQRRKAHPRTGTEPSHPEDSGAAYTGENDAGIRWSWPDGGDDDGQEDLSGDGQSPEINTPRGAGWSSRSGRTR